MNLLRVSAAALVMATASASAQTSGLSIGLLGGLNSTTFGGRDAAKFGYTSKYGPVMGGLVQKEVGRWLFVRTGAWLSRAGAQAPDSVDPNRGTAVRLNYVKMPLFVGIMLPGRFGISPHVFGGIEGGAKAGCKHETWNGSAMKVRDCNATVVSFSAKSFDLAFAGGGGFNYRLSELSYLIVDASTSRSRYKVGTDAKAPMLKNQAVTVNVGLMVRERRP